MHMTIDLGDLPTWLELLALIVGLGIAIYVPMRQRQEQLADARRASDEARQNVIARQRNFDHAAAVVLLPDLKDMRHAVRHLAGMAEGPDPLKFKVESLARICERTSPAYVLDRVASESVARADQMSIELRALVLDSIRKTQSLALSYERLVSPGYPKQQWVMDVMRPNVRTKFLDPALIASEAAVVALESIVQQVRPGATSGGSEPDSL